MPVVRALYTASEQTVAPTCGVCGRKLGVGFYFACHICGATFCYAHAPQKCAHVKVRQTATKAPLVR